VEGCLYLYVTITQVAAIAYSRLDQGVARESREAGPVLSRSIRPQWGAYLYEERVVERSVNRDGDVEDKVM